MAGLQPGDPSEIGPYRLLGQLGSGGMGQVFLGMSAGGRPIAVKVIRAELADDPEFRTRFQSEVDAARKVSGLFTAMVVDADLDGPIPWLATAYVAGPSLAEAVRSHGPLPDRTLLALAGGLAESLGAIHDAGVVHRDLKPSNVLLAEDGPRVIDFGISEAAEASPVVGANVIGSPGYMSPEQVMGLDVGPASDMFSLGAVLAFAGTGEGPFGSGSNAAVIHRLVNNPANLAKLPDDVRPLVGKLLAKHPNDRPTARELLAMVGPIQPARGWLSESIIYGPAAGQSAAELLSAASAGNVIPFAAAAAGQPGPGSKGRAGRHRLSRPVASAGITGGLVAASAAAVFVLTGAVPHTLGSPSQPRAGAALAAPAGTAPAPASVNPRSSSSVSPAAPGANAALSPSLSEFLRPSSPATVTPSQTPAPAKSPAASVSPSASGSSPAPASSSSSASASPTSSSSPTASASSSPSPSASTSTSASPSPTQSTSSSPSSSPPQSASPIASVTVSPSASAS